VNPAAVAKEIRSFHNDVAEGIAQTS
jgi:hypothetical protein